jgi:amphi-Trp domain-containing protein
MSMKEAARAAKEKSAELVDRFRSKGSYMLHEDKIYFETLDDPDTVKELLLHVVEGIDQGRVILANEEEEMVFYPGSLLKLAIKGKKTQSTSKIKLSISWSRLDEDRYTLDDEPPHPSPLDVDRNTAPDADSGVNSEADRNKTMEQDAEKTAAPPESPSQQSPSKE